MSGNGATPITMPAVMPTAALERIAVPAEFAARLADLAAMARKTTVTADEIVLVRVNIETLELLLGGQAFGQRP